MDQAKVSVGGPSAADPEPQRVAPAVAPAAQAGTSSFADHKKMCTHKGCTTRVSIYNSSTTCWAHS